MIKEPKRSYRKPKLEDKFKELSSLGKAENVAIIIVDKKGRVVYWSRGAERLTGYKIKDVIGKPISSFYPHRREMKSILKEVREKGYSGPKVVKVRHKKKGEIYINLFVDRFLSPCGEELGTIGVSYDVTEMIKLEEEAKEKERMFRMIFEKSPMGIFVTDKKGNIIAANPALIRIMGSPGREKTEGLNVLKLPTLKKVNATQKFKRVLLKRELVSFESEYTSLWGKKIYATVVGMPIIEKKKVTGMLGIVADITKRKTLEEGLRKRTYVLEKILETERRISLERSLEENLNELAKGAAEATGFKIALIRVVENGIFGLVGAYGIPKNALSRLKKRVITGEKIREFLNPKYKHGDAYFISHEEEIAKKVEEGEYIPPIIYKKGGWHPRDMFLVPIYSPSRSLMGVIMFDDPVDGSIPSKETSSYALIFAEMAGYWIDILKTHALLKHEINKLNTLIYTSYVISKLLSIEKLGKTVLAGIKNLTDYDQAVFYLYDEGKKKMEAVAFTGISAKEIRKREKTALERHPGWVVKNREALISEDVEKDKRVKYNGKVSTKSLLYVPVIFEDKCLGALGLTSFKKNAFSEEDKEMLKVFASQVAVAVSNARAMEVEIKARKAAEEFENLKSGIIASLSHELKTPLTIIRATAELMRMSFPQKEKEYRELVNTIISESEKLGTLITRLLSFSMSFAKVLSVEKKVLNPDAIVERVISMMRKKALEKKINIYTELKARNAKIIASPDAVESICINLIDNAIRYNKKKGSIIIKTRVYNKNYILEVKDTGTGIPEDKLLQIFEPFYRVELEDTRRTYGAGIGLTIVKRFAEILGGKVEVKSKLGEGSVFRVTLPVVREK